MRTQEEIEKKCEERRVEVVELTRLANKLKAEATPVGPLRAPIGSALNNTLAKREKLLSEYAALLWVLNYNAKQIEVKLLGALKGGGGR